MTELEKNMQLLHTGDLYVCNSPEMFRLQMEYRSLIWQYNQMDPRDMDGHAALLPRIFAEVGEGCFIEPPFNANWGALPTWAETSTPTSTSPSPTTPTFTSATM